MFGHDEHFLKLKDDIDKTQGAQLFLLNIGSLHGDKHNYQEMPLFLNNIDKGLKVEIFNIDTAYKHNPVERRYNVELNYLRLLNLACICIRKHKAKLIIFDNTCSSGLNITHEVAQKLKESIGVNMEVLIGYGMHGYKAIIPILQLRKEFIDSFNKNSSDIVRQFVLNYCDECQALLKVHYPICQKFAAEHALVLPKDRSFLVASSNVQNTLRFMANEKGLNIFFTLDEFSKIRLFSANEALEREQPSVGAQRM